jgi:hypothetical protein
MAKNIDPSIRRRKSYNIGDFGNLTNLCDKLEFGLNKIRDIRLQKE